MNFADSEVVAAILSEEYRLCQDLSEAEVVLKGSDEKMDKIAEMLGFHNAAQFGTFFKKETGMTPGEYRNGKVIPERKTQRKINS